MKIIKFFLLVKQYLRAKFYGIAIQLPENQLSAILQKYSLDDWFLHVYKHRWRRWEFWETCLWIARYIPRDAKVLELGCGCGWNLLWLSQRGFSFLKGIDIDSFALSAMSELSSIAGGSIEGVRSDFFEPNSDEECYDVIFSLSAIRLDSRFEPSVFFELCSKRIKKDGYIIVDVVDPSFNLVPNNQYHTADWEKPEEKRRETEHLRRYSLEEMKTAAEKMNLKLVHCLTNPMDKLCLRVYFFRKTDR